MNIEEARKFVMAGAPKKGTPVAANIYMEAWNNWKDATLYVAAFEAGRQAEREVQASTEGGKA